MFTRDLDTVQHDLRVLVGGLDPDAIPLGEVLALWKTFNQVEVLAASAKTLLARRVEDGNTWNRAGYRSAEEQLAVLAGTSVTAAKNSLATSKHVKKLPKTAAAMRKGKLSAAKAKAIAGAADVAPDAADRLLDGADKKPLGQLREECLKAKAVDRDKTHARIRRNRRARVYKDGEGAWHLHAHGTVDAGADFEATWRPLIDAQFKLAKAEGREEPLEAYAFDALMELAKLAATRATATSGADPAAPPTKPKRTPAKDLSLIRIDYESLVRGAVEGEETCEIAGLGPIPVRIARERLGDAILKLVIMKGVDVANVTHLGRSPTVGQQVALWWRSHDCTRLGCTRTQRLENDHREEWTKTHHTRLDELDPLCAHDHDLKTHEGWALIEGTGK